MRNTKKPNLLYILSSAAISLTFIIKLVLDAIYKNTAQGITGILSLKILVCSIIMSLLGFALYVYVQYRVESKQKILSCPYNPNFMCCLLESGSLEGILENGSELLDDIKLAKHERQIETKEIWLLSPDLSVEDGNNVFREVVRARLNEGVHYSFVALDSPISQERAKRIRNRYKSFFTKKRMHFYLINGDEYTLFLSLYSLVIYNPSNAEDTEAFVCVGETEGSETSVYAKLNELHTQTATNITREIIRNTKEFIP